MNSKQTMTTEKSHWATFCAAILIASHLALGAETDDKKTEPSAAVAAVAVIATNTAEAVITNAVVVTNAVSTTNIANAATLAAIDSAAASPTDAAKAGMASTNEVQLSFQSANIDAIVQWLAQTTGKTVMKHPRVQCQITIMGLKKVTPKDAVAMVYRALSMEGFNAIETTKAILIVPEGQEPKMPPELFSSSKSELPDGRQKVLKVFTLHHLQSAELKDKIKSVLSEKAVLEVNERSNQIIVTDYADNVRLLDSLINALDADNPEDLSVRMLPLKHVTAAELAKEIGPIYQKMAGKAVHDLIEVGADDRSNSLIILANEANFSRVKALVDSLDAEDAQEKVIKTFTLKNADAQDVAKQMQDLNQNQDRQTRSPYYYGFQPETPKSNKKLNAVADRRRNAVVVQAPPGDMEGITKIIDELDSPVMDNSLAPKIYPLKYISATDIEDVLNELFLKKQQQRPYWGYNPYEESGASNTEQDAGRLYGKVRITSEPHANAIIVTSNSKENLAVIEDVLQQLDHPADAGESTLRIDLKYAKASTVANAINILFAKNGSPPLRPVAQPGQNQPQSSPQGQNQLGSTRTGFDLEQSLKEDGYFPWLGGQPDNPRTDGKNGIRPVSDLVGRVRSVADERSNALLISASVHFFPQIVKLINEMDAPTDQVLIEARLIEVSSDFLDKLGVRWSPDGSKVLTPDDYDNSLLAHATTTYQKGYGGNTTVNTPSSATLAQALGSLRSGVVSGNLSMDFLVQFLRKTTEATVLANPQINIRDNETGRLFVGQQVPIPDNTSVSQLGGQNTSFKYKDVGVVLEVTPHINNTGDVELKLHAESSTVVPGQTVLNGLIFDTRNFRTDLTAKNGQTLVVGGIIQRQISDTLRKTPILGSIPGLGWAFKKRDKNTREVELLVFLRPRIVHNGEDAKTLLRETTERAPLIEDAQKKFDETNKPKQNKKK
ncbi:MAG: hypothetical protein JWM68_4737 [Verrucomicrobiales bacterium]|nr:hypothetical protein [Verrucomicrobiales bacterium]